MSVYHVWGDPWFDEHGQDLSYAMDYIVDTVYRKTRCRLIVKEKWGTVRYQYVFCPGATFRSSLHIKAPWTRTLYGKKYRPVLWSWPDSWLARRWVKWGWDVTKRAALEASLKWPNVKEEIMEDLGWI